AENPPRNGEGDHAAKRNGGGGPHLHARCARPPPPRRFASRSPAPVRGGIMIAILAFYLFATLTIGSALAVIFARNPVHSVLWLILAFFNAAGLMLLVGAEFIALLLVIVYVGPVAGLFLFVVMMLDIDFAQLRSGFTANLPFGIIIAFVLL